MTADPKIGRGIAPRPVPACGTYPAVKRHLHAGVARSELDPACLAELRRYQADAAQRARAKRAGR